MLYTEQIIFQRKIIIGQENCVFSKILLPQRSSEKSFPLEIA